MVDEVDYQPLSTIINNHQPCTKHGGAKYNHYWTFFPADFR
jgi:hypothetical protein